ncbi:type I-E CRISPR-associated endoribonuclease Cas2e [Streptomyces decoyicus]
MASMIALSLTAVPDHLRGALTRWLVEVTPELYVGTVSAKVRDELWKTVANSTGKGGAALPGRSREATAVRRVCTAASRYTVSQAAVGSVAVRVPLPRVVPRPSPIRPSARSMRARIRQARMTGEGSEPFRWPAVRRTCRVRRPSSTTSSLCSSPSRAPPKTRSSGT